MGEQLIDSLIDWFWRDGHRRQGKYALGTGTWLDKLYALRSSMRSVTGAQRNQRACFALWGPSQAGKSTLLSRSFDTRQSDTPNAPQSALQWSPTEPVVFLGREDTPRNCIQLNPFNQGSDASGCVSRFVLRDKVEDALHPVELRFATDVQILHSIAAGFLSECDLRAGPTQETFFDPEKLDQLLRRYSTTPAVPTINRIAYERLRQVADVLDDLISAEWGRYRNLHAEWEPLRSRLLENSCLLSNPDLVDDFAAKLFWNDELNLTSLYRRLRDQRQQIRQLSAGKSLFCSYRIARLFLNIDSYKDYVSGKSNEAEFDIKWSISGNSVVLDHVGTNQLFADPSEFGAWQALVWELIFPVNATTIKRNAPRAAEFLKNADLQDFPGVALQGPGGVRKQAREMIPEELLTKLVKRGKTSSVVANSARELGIDAFCLLVRMSTPPAQPDQLIHGIKSWLAALNLPMPPARDDSVPLNLVLTFGAKIVNEELFRIRNNRPRAGFESVFSWLDRLGPLADPAWARYFVTTYPQWPDGKIHGKTEDLDGVCAEIIQDESFVSRFGPQSESIKSMFLGGRDADGDGGTTFLIEQLTKQAQASRIPTILARRKTANSESLQALLNEALPIQAGDQRKSDLTNWRNAISDAIRRHRQAKPMSDAAMQVSLKLRELLNVDANFLEAVPLHARNLDVTSYVGRQFNSHWLQTKHTAANAWTSIGLKDQATTERVLGYLSEYALRNGTIEQWLRQHLGDLSHRKEAEHARRFLAMKMADALCSGTNRRTPHRTFSEVQSRLEEYARNESRSGAERLDVESPHYKGFISGFQEHLATVADSAPGLRPAQPGDEQLRQLRESLKTAKEVI